MKKFKYLLLIMLMTFISLPNVNAIDGTLNTPSQNNWIVSSSADCFNSNGNNLSTSFVNNTFSYDNISFNPYYQCNSFYSGSILAFNIGQKTSVNQLYSLTIYVGSSNNATLSNSSTTIGLGNWGGGAVDSLINNTPTRPTLYSYSDSSNLHTNFYQPTDSSLAEVSTGTIYVIFKANTEFPFFALKLFYNSNPGNIYFWGYNLTPLGDTSGLTSSQVSNIVNNAVDNMATSQDINEIQENITDTETNIKSKIDESTDKLGNTINDNFNTCTPANKNLVDLKTFVNGYPSSSGSLTNTIGSVGCLRSPNLIKVKPNTTYTFSIKSTSSDFEKWIGVAFYKSNATTSFIKRVTTNSNTFTFTTTSDTNYIAIGAHNLASATEVQLEQGSSSTGYVEYQEECKNKIDETNDQLGDLNNNITNSDTSSSENQANSFFEDFNTNDYGLSDIVTMPLQLIRSLTNNTCVSLSLTLPFVNKTFELPCMSSIYEEYFGSFFDLYQLITFGFISYWVVVRIFNLVKDFKNPDHDEIEVLDL